MYTSCWYTSSILKHFWEFSVNISTLIEPYVSDRKDWYAIKQLVSFQTASWPLHISKCTIVYNNLKCKIIGKNITTTQWFFQMPFLIKGFKALAFQTHFLKGELCLLKVQRTARCTWARQHQTEWKPAPVQPTQLNCTATAEKRGINHISIQLASQQLERRWWTSFKQMKYRQEYTTLEDLWGRHCWQLYSDENVAQRFECLWFCGPRFT